MNFADMAIAAATSEAAAEEFEQRAQRTREHAQARRLIFMAAQRLGVQLDVDTVHDTRPGSTLGPVFAAEVEIDVDARLVFSYEPHPVVSDGPKLQVSVRPSEQLYWNLPLGQETKDPAAGGVFGCYGLGQHSGLNDVRDTADVGRALLKIRAARELWRRKHCASTAS